MPLWPWTTIAVLRERVARLEFDNRRLTADHDTLTRKHDRLVDQCLAHVGATHEPIRDLPKATTDPLRNGFAAVMRSIGRMETTTPTPQAKDDGPTMTT